MYCLVLNLAFKSLPFPFKDIWSLMCRELSKGNWLTVCCNPKIIASSQFQVGLRRIFDSVCFDRNLLELSNIRVVAQSIYRISTVYKIAYAVKIVA